MFKDIFEKKMNSEAYGSANSDSFGNPTYTSEENDETNNKIRSTDEIKDLLNILTEFCIRDCELYIEYLKTHVKSRSDTFYRIFKVLFRQTNNLENLDDSVFKLLTSNLVSLSAVNDSSIISEDELKEYLSMDNNEQIIKPIYTSLSVIKSYLDIENDNSLENYRKKNKQSNIYYSLEENNDNNEDINNENDNTEENETQISETTTNESDDFTETNEDQTVDESENSTDDSFNENSESENNDLPEEGGDSTLDKNKTGVNPFQVLNSKDELYNKSTEFLSSITIIIEKLNSINFKDKEVIDELRILKDNAEKYQENIYVVQPEESDFKWSLILNEYKLIMKKIDIDLDEFNN